MKKPRPIVRYGPTWRREERELLKDFAPEIRACKDCTHPVVAGYQCTFCGSSKP